MAMLSSLAYRRLPGGCSCDMMNTCTAFPAGRQPHTCTNSLQSRAPALINTVLNETRLLRVHHTHARTHAPQGSPVIAAYSLTQNGVKGIFNKRGNPPQEDPWRVLSQRTETALCKHRAGGRGLYSAPVFANIYLAKWKEKNETKEKTHLF